MNFDVSPEEWDIIDAGDFYTIQRMNYAGTYTVPKGVKGEKAAKLIAKLDPAEISKVIDGKVDYTRCTCKVGWTTERCITFTQVSAIRAE